MTKLEELKVACDDAYEDALDAAYATIAAYAADDDAYAAAKAANAAAWDAYKAELKKTKENSND